MSTQSTPTFSTPPPSGVPSGSAVAGNTPPASPVAGGTQASTQPDSMTVYALPIAESPWTGGDMPENNLALVIPENLENEVWWKSGLVGNPHTRRLVAPIYFQLVLNELSPSEYLPTKVGGKTPLKLYLNCSLSQVQQKMKHVINKANTRTGVHITFWGMEPDMITGSGSTGVFMNYYGITNLMSSRLFGVEGESNSATISVIREAFQNTPAILNDARNTMGKFKVAAQDAFVELLSLFKNNGMVRFQPENYTAKFDTELQVAKTVWSSQYGATKFERQARNNDIMNKGLVIMTLKGNVFQGYFKSFGWTMDADNPFHWKFDFSFQVQKTISYTYYNG